MRVGAFAEFGDASMMRVEHRVPPPPPRGTELLVAVGASSVNGTDLGLRRGDLRPITWGRMPFVPGFDVAGTVVAVGSRVSAFRPGDRVAALLPHRGGGLAEQLLLDQDRAALVGGGVDLVTAAAVPLAGLTALQALHRVGRLPRGDHRSGSGPRVLVAGGAGGIGAYAVQLAVLAGADVTATTSAGKLDFVRGLGAHRVVDRRAPGALAGCGPFDLVLDAAGRHPYRDLAPALAAGGTLVTVRPLHPDVLRSLRPGGPRVAAVRTAPRSADLTHLLHLIGTRELRAPVEHVVGLADVADAHRIAEREGRGKVVVDLTR